MKNLNAIQLKKISRIFGALALISIMIIITLRDKNETGIPPVYGLPVMFVLLGAAFSQKAKKKEEEHS
ncbi:hypothetical protein [Flavobacterium sp. N1994]|uniref:hypothetical protein n=1 Tax=Flavobacterium sp. N1994 TaxID=2986827 RepID=UPI002223A25E|nr:hypothetical protein [Flavobacterium sp. N1994]